MVVVGERLKKTKTGLVRTGEWVELSAQARKQSVYITGTTGTGKTTLLTNIIYQDMLSGDGVCVIDPHGDLIEDLLAIVPEDRVKDVVVFAPGDYAQQQQPLGLNILVCDRDDPRQVRRITSTVIDTLRKLFEYSWGPRMEDLLRNSILTLMETEDTTLLDLWLLLASPRHRTIYTKQDPHTEKSTLRDAYLRQFWDVQFRGYTKSHRDLVDLVGSSLNKIGRFLADPDMRRIVAQPRSALKLREIMDERKILLVNLSKGDLGQDNATLLGAVLLNLILIAAMTRRDTPKEERVPFHLIVDEFQNFATSDTFAVLQSEARKFGIDTIVAHQYRDQLDILNKGATLNVANFIVLRVSGIDAQELATQFDNTPPPPDFTYQAVRQEVPDYPGHYRPIPEEQKVPLPRRAYTDVAAERANTLAGQDNLVAYARLLVDKADMQHPAEKRLQEYTVRVPFLSELYDVAPDGEKAVHIKAQSVRLGVSARQVDEDIRRVIGEVDFDTLTLSQEQVLDESDE